MAPVTFEQYQWLVSQSVELASYISGDEFQTLDPRQQERVRGLHQGYKDACWFNRKIRENTPQKEAA